MDHAQHQQGGIPPGTMPGKGKMPAEIAGKAGIKRIPVLSPEQVRRLLGSIDTTTEAGLRDLAMIGVMIHCFVPPGVVPGLRVVDYEREGADRWLWPHAGHANARRVPLSAAVAASLDGYVEAAGFADDGDGPLFRAASGRNCPATGWDVLRMIRKRAWAAGLDSTITRHTLRASGLLMFLQDGGTIEQAKAMAGFMNDQSLERYTRRGALSAGPGAHAGSAKRAFHGGAGIDGLRPAGIGIQADLTGPMR